ncbi:MAG: GGDEF domain-containing protein [Gammaproteobacteria bacterium]|nr:GGDEF domain-containing protein [Gammaproteobacteria bacterium]
MNQKTPRAGVPPSTRPEPIKDIPTLAARKNENSIPPPVSVDQGRDDALKLQETILRNLSDALIQNREFGALLQIQLDALKQADSSQEVETLRRILLDGIDEVLKGQRSLHSKIERATSDTRLLKVRTASTPEKIDARAPVLVDALTGLPNRRAFLRRLIDEIGRAERYGTPLTLVMLDVDGVKTVNATYGQVTGDEILRAYVTHVFTALRRHDHVARFGGEKFAVLLPNTNVDGATTVLHNAIRRAGQTHCLVGVKSLPVPSFSAGVTPYSRGDMSSMLVGRADRALLRAKSLGGNQFVVELVTADPTSPLKDINSGLANAAARSPFVRAAERHRAETAR